MSGAGKELYLEEVWSRFNFLEFIVSPLLVGKKFWAKIVSFLKFYKLHLKNDISRVILFEKIDTWKKF